MPRLKSLELHGYKTFASRTLFEFPAVITAVVGPNGSGKSNIADALRWVLGEQSYSLLRGRKTEDMIFAGSDQRPRAGMASASITFDNEDGWLPIDFSEVSIARRAYRDGQNEYLLNGQRVRLKEITELLAQSGLAERTYTIIGQGLVDAALSLKPEERRRFFEEAAGIGLYRGRRDESINRLDTTRRNLERVQDILSELEPRLQSLEKQARRVQEYERIKAELRILLREWYGYHFHRSQEALTHSREVVRVQGTRLDQGRQRFEAIEGQLKAERVRLQDLRTRLNEWHAQMAGLHQQREQVSRTLAVMNERQRALLEQQQSLQNDIAGLEETQKANQARLQSLVQERDWLQDELSEAQNQATVVQQNLQVQQSERADLEVQLNEMRRQVISNERLQVQQKAHHSELVNRLENQRKTQQSLFQALKDGELAIHRAKENLTQVNEQRQSIEEESQKIDDETQSLRRRISELEIARRKAQEEGAQFDAETTRLRTQLEVLEQAEKSFSGLNQGARYILQEARQGKFKGKFSAISNQVDVPKEYEQAIASVLGNHLDGILLDDQSDLENALVLLGKGEKGRTVLVSLPDTRSYEKGIEIQEQDCFGLAADLVHYPVALKPLINLLLGQVWVVRDRNAARHLLNKLPAAGCAVTLQGEVFWGTGVVEAGQDGRAGVIGRPRQKRELQEKLTAIQEKYRQTAQVVRACEVDLEKQRTFLSEMGQQLRLVSQRMSQENKAYQQANLELERLHQKQDWQHNQATNLDTQVKQSEEEIQQISVEMKLKIEQVRDLYEKVKKLNRDLADLPLDELLAQVTHWNMGVAVAGRALQEAERRLIEHQQAFSTNEQQKESFEQRLEVGSTALQKLEEDRASYRLQEGEENRMIEVLQAQIEPSEKELEIVESEFSRLQDNQIAAQQAVTVGERFFSQAQLEMTRCREALESLRKRIEEDFGLVAFEYASNIAGPTPLPLEGMVEQLPVIKEIPPELEESINRQKTLLRRLGAINPEAQTEYQSVYDRFHFLTNQVEDLKKADADLRLVITELDEMMRIEFRKTFDAVAAEFRQMFTRLFGGGSAHLSLTDEDDPNETGIDIETRLPGHREQGLSLLSGGERSLTAVALIFSLLKVSPTPFCVLDEVDAMLDEANVGRFCELLIELSQKTQFLVITHNRNTVQSAGVIYGVTMGRDSTSLIISLKLDEVNEEMVE